MGTLFDFKLVFTQIPELLKYLPVTLELALISMVFSLFLGLIIAVIRLKRIAVLTPISSAYISIIRGTPILVQLYVVYFGIPLVLKYINMRWGTNYNVNGVPPRPMETKNEIDERGAFVRQPNAFIVPFGDQNGQWKAEAGRYAIYWAKGCNWSNRPVIARDLLGLKGIVEDQLTTHSGETNVYGHGFGDAPDHRDPLTGAYFLSEFYKNANPDFRGRATTPTLVDIKEKKAVNNDYHRMTNYLEVQFRALQPKDAPDLYPKAFRKEIDEFNDWLFPHVNNSHYRMAFCQSLEAYNEAYDDFYESLDKLEKRLETNRFLFGDYITDSDIRFFVTVVRWDISYFRNIGPVKKRIQDYKNIWGYAKELYAIPAFRNNTYIRELLLHEKKGDQEKDLFFDWNYRIGSQIDFDELWADDGARAALSKTPEEKYLRHPEGETAEDYQSQISVSKWNSPKQEDRDPSNPANGVLSVDASINPLQGRL